MDKLHTIKGSLYHAANSKIAFAVVGSSTLLMLTHMVITNGYGVNVAGKLPIFDSDFRFALFKSDTQNTA
ncbi:hypothetical protein AALC25_00150 [Lachnospiraceae bacterium 29-84]